MKECISWCGACVTIHHSSCNWECFEICMVTVNHMHALVLLNFLHAWMFLNYVGGHMESSINCLSVFCVFCHSSIHVCKGLSQNTRLECQSDHCLCYHCFLLEHPQYFRGIARVK